jgi:hypothetical protein
MPAILRGDFESPASRRAFCFFCSLAPERSASKVGEDRRNMAREVNMNMDLNMNMNLNMNMIL